MRNKRSIGLVLLITCLYLSLFSITVKGEDVSYSVRAILPDNQIDNTKTYFDLKVKENKEQQLQTVIYNHEQEEITVRLSVYPATTNSNGIIVYEDTEELDSSLKTALPDILKFDEELVTIPAGSSKNVTATLRTEDEVFDGIILGGLHFEKVNEEEDTAEGVNIQNNYAYVIGVQLSQNTKEVPPKLHAKKTYADLKNHRPAVITQIQNSAPTIVSDLTVHAKIYEKGESEPIRKKTQEDINMAPNSHINLNMDWNNERLEAGDYTIQLNAQHHEDTWEWEDNFTIEKKEAEEINTEAVDLNEKDSKNIWYVIGIAVLGLIIIILILYIRQLKRKQTARES